MPRCPRPLSLALAGALACLQVLWTQLSSGFGLVPLLRPHLSPERPAQRGPRPSYATGLLFRILVVYRWWRRSNFAGRGLAALYLRRAHREVAALPRREVAADPLPSHAVDALSPDAFFERYGRAARPVVIRGLHRVTRDWSLDALTSEYGDTDVLFNEGWGYRLRPLRALRESAAPERYVANCEQLLIRNPALLAQLDVPRYRAWTRRVPYCAQLFIGARRSLGLYFHCANNFNVFTMLHGRKRWTLVHPEFSYCMYPIVSRESAYVASIINHVEARPEWFDLFRHCPRYEIVLEPGDVLFNPPWWWHQVENLDEGTVGCATRWAGLASPETNRLFSFAQSASPSMLRATVSTLSALIECGGDLERHYRRLACAPGRTTIIEDVSHTGEAMERGARFESIFPRPT